MKKSFIIRLLILAVLSISLYSCVHDDLSSSLDPSSKEYENKSLWKEDEKYIQNVIQVYRENETKIKKFNGTPFWDYATTMDRFDESFLMVPVVENKKVVSVLQVPRHGKNIYFIYTNEADDIAFFQNIISTRTKKALPNEASNETNRLVCTTRAISVWLPSGGGDSNPGSGQGSWSTYHVTSCKNVQQEGCVGIVGPDGECTGGSGDGDPYPYPGGGGDGPQDPEPPEDPCAKTKSNLTNPKVKAKIKDLKDQSILPESDPNFGEKGVKFKADGTPSNLIVGGKHNVDFGDKTGYQGGYHNHTTGTPMFSPADIEQLLQFALAQPTSNPANASNAYLGMVAPNGMHYVIQFNGNYDGALVTFSQYDLDNYSIKYQNISDVMLLDPQYSTDHLNLNNKGVEALFFDTLKKMGLDGKVNLQRIESGGVIKNIQLDSANQPVPVTCP
ncbi:hypothetical protein A0O34_20590 [Chryseobacterium glaciei]|uniref:Uncharacterized protein n=1 Tax=Chryseobacterium glaciei TaxID=1685010 RepID=A0A172Y0M3_9FLAO|nr:hypothetical protein [Chryseobacterium glaciei]ANF52764.1 hypothetical protein A0O34_20590 [Chryseobacterium glaciei]